MRTPEQAHRHEQNNADFPIFRSFSIIIYTYDNIYNINLHFNIAMNDTPIYNILIARI